MNCFLFFCFFNFLPLPVSSSLGRCLFPLTAFVKPLSLKLDSQEGVCLTTDGLRQSLLGCSVFRSVSLINVCGCSTRYLTFIYVLLLLCRDDIPQPCLYAVGFVCLFVLLFCIDNILNHLWTRSKLKNLCLFSNTWFILVNDWVIMNSQIHMVKCYYSQVKARDGRKFCQRVPVLTGY